MQTTTQRTASKFAHSQAPFSCTRRAFLAHLPVLIALPWIVLPGLGRADAEAGPNAPPSCDPNLIFVVDDMPDLLQLNRQVLQNEAFQVQTFCDRSKALDAFRKANPRPGLLITDFEGYPFSAATLIQKCRDVDPQLKVLMVTGHWELTLDSDWPANARPDQILHKPCDLQQLVASVRALLPVPPRPPSNLRIVAQ